jgi:hypothetical protein
MKSVILYVLCGVALIFVMLPHGGEVFADGPNPNPNRLLSGSYSGIFSGYLVTSTGNQPLAGTGLFISDGKGNLTGHEVFNLNGHACEYQLKGTYAVSADGTGTDDIDFINGGPGCPDGSFTQSLAVVDGGDLILLSNTNFPDVATERWYRVGKRQFQSGATGACCFSTSLCKETDQATCTEQGGLYQGHDTSCSSSLCAIDTR